MDINEEIGSRMREVAAHGSRGPLTLPPNQLVGLKAKLAVRRRSDAMVVLPLKVPGIAATYLPYACSDPALRAVAGFQKRSLLQHRSSTELERWQEISQPVSRRIDTGQFPYSEFAMVDNPHNQTLAVAIQWGMFGCLALFAMWGVHIWLFRGAAAGSQHSLVAWIGLLAVVQNVLSSLLNSHLFDFYEGWLYLLIVAIAGGTLQRARGRDPEACRALVAASS